MSPELTRNLDYRQLHTFWTVARKVSVTRASAKLLLVQPTVSGQLRELELAIGTKLVPGAGRGIILTASGRHVFITPRKCSRSAVKCSTVCGANPAGALVGIADVVPKTISFRLLNPVLQTPDKTRVVCREGKLQELLADLTLHWIDPVVSDSPISPGSSIRAYSRLVGDSGVTLRGVASLARRYRRRFPKSLDGAPLILPTDKTVLRRSLNDWLAASELRQRIVAEFEDSVLVKFVASGGAGLFASPTSVEKDVCRTFGGKLVGRVPEIRERFYAISAERRVRNPAVVRLLESSQQTLIT